LNGKQVYGLHNEKKNVFARQNSVFSGKNWFLFKNSLWGALILSYILLDFVVSQQQSLKNSDASCWFEKTFLEHFVDQRILSSMLSTNQQAFLKPQWLCWIVFRPFKVPESNSPICVSSCPIQGVLWYKMFNLKKLFLRVFHKILEKLFLRKSCLNKPWIQLHR